MKIESVREEIDGKTYDTEKTDRLYLGKAWPWCKEMLFRSDEGAWFICADGKKKGLRPLTEREAFGWCLLHLDEDELDFMDDFPGMRFDEN